MSQPKAQGMVGKDQGLLEIDQGDSEKGGMGEARGTTPYNNIKGQHQETSLKDNKVHNIKG